MTPSIRLEEKFMMTIDGKTYPSWITLINKYIEYRNLPSYSSEDTLIKKKSSGNMIVIDL